MASRDELPQLQPWHRENLWLQSCDVSALEVPQRCKMVYLGQIGGCRPNTFAPCNKAAILLCLLHDVMSNQRSFRSSC